MSWILYALSGYDPKKDAREPLREAKKRTADNTDKLPEDVKPNVKTRWLEKSGQEGENPTWENLNAQKRNEHGREVALNQADIDYIEHFQQDWEYLTFKKAEELKPYWAANYSAKECAAAFQNRRGYKLDTMKKYWRIFNQNHSPIE
jgi:hypothetical protein